MLRHTQRATLLMFVSLLATSIALPSPDSVHAAVPSDSMAGWSEVIASVGYGLVGYSEYVERPGATIQGSGCARFSVEYRYFVDKILSIGISTAYLPFRYDRDEAEGYPTPHVNHVISLEALATIRTTKYRENGAFVLTVGAAVSHLRLYATTLQVNDTLRYGPEGMQVPVQDVADWRVGIRFGLGAESPLIADRIRLRFMMDYLVPVTFRELSWLAFPGSVGISYAF